MVNLEILVDGKPFDYQDRNDFGLLFRKSIGTSLNTRSDVVSFTTNFPATQNNLDILGLNTYMDNYQKFNKDAPFRIEILVNSVSLVRGILVVQLYSNNIIQGLIIGDGISQASLIQNKSIQDLNMPSIPFLGGIDILQRQDDFKVMQDANGNSFEHSQVSPICFPLISYGTYFVPNRTARRHDIDNTDQSTLVNNDTLTMSEIPALKYSDIPPSVYYSRVFRQIFLDIGYKVTGSQINSNDIIDLTIPCLGSDEIIYNYNTIGGFSLSCNTLHQIPADTTIDPTGRNYVANNYNNETPLNNRVQTYRTCQTDTLTFRNNFTLSNNYGLTHTYPTQTYPSTALEPYWICPTDGEYEQQFSVGIYNQTYVGNVGFNADVVPAFALVRVNDEDEEQVRGQFQMNTTTHMIIQNYYGMSAPYNVPATMLPPTSNNLGADTIYRKVFPTNGFDNVVFIFNLIDIPTTNPSPAYPSYSGTFKAKRGDKFKLIMINGSATIAAPIDNRFKVAISNGFYLNISCVDADIYPDNYDGIDLNPNINLPNISQTDFVKDAITRYNLYFVVNEQDKTIMFESQNNFYSGNPYKLQGKFIEASQKEVPERQQFNYQYDSNDYLTSTDTDQDYTKRSEMRYVGDIENVSTIQSKTEMQRYGIINKNNTSLADFNSSDLTFQQSSGAIISIPQISDKAHYNSLQSSIYDSNGNLIESYEDQTLEYDPRLLRMSGYYDLHLIYNGGLPIRYQDESGATILAKDIRIFQPEITAATNTNLDQTYLYDTYYNGLITEYQASEIVKFLVYIDYLDFTELKTNRLIDIDGVLYRIVEFQPFNPINPKPIVITLQKVL